MTANERLLAFYRRETQGGISVAAYDTLIPRGSVERTLRNKGLGLLARCPISSLISPSFVTRAARPVPNVEVTLRYGVEDGETVTVRTFDTPVGRVSEKYRKDPVYGTLWIRKYLIEAPADYAVVRYIVENSIVAEEPEGYLLASRNLGDDGLVLGMVDRTPIQKVLWELAGPERLAFDLHDNRPMVDELLSAIESQLDVVYRIAGASPASVIWSPDNLTGDICSPSMYREYHLRYYRRWAEVLHDRNKVYAVHMDGRLRSLCELIKQTPVDVIESFSVPLVGGDLLITDALDAWRGKAIAVNLPASLCGRGHDEVRLFLQELLALASPRRALLLQVSEDLPPTSWQHCLSAVMDSMKSG